MTGRRQAMTNMRSGDPDPTLTDYYPAWLDNLADDVTLEGSAMDGFVQGPEAVRAVLVSIRGLYDYQKFNFAGPYGENDWLEDYTAGVSGEANRQLHGGQAQRAPGRRSTSWATTGPAARRCSCPGWLARSSPAPPTRSTSSPASRERRPHELLCHPGGPRLGHRSAEPARRVHRHVHQPVRRHRAPAPACGHRRRRSPSAAGAWLAADLVCLAAGDARASAGLPGHRARPARVRAVRQASGRL